ncbi:hypothetical protein I5412_14240 [Citrobacter koseri]|uniref:hypothetical protein n=1 Tax=Citrobacter koseri TaxID=545 RepID=UPI00106F72FF|nr:hypothetical protein [Citrobacter koseri]MBJ8876132.1 hypothetical protein [Citrobacter koseri]VFS12766.1 Uncharacterised protein [Citrobacter koseri]
MRDFNSGDIIGDVNIIDNSNNNQFKLLIHCDNEELLQEEAHRWNLVKKERNQRLTGVLWVFAFCAVLLLIAAGWYFIMGKMELINSLIGGAGVVVGLMNLANADKPTEFEVRQLNTLKEINTLLRERGVR